MTYTSLFGTFRSRNDVVSAVVSTLRTWILTYLAEVERQEGMTVRTLTPPGSEWPTVAGYQYASNAVQFRGGRDFEVWQGDILPILIAVVQPIGNAERYEEGKYQQWYEIQVGAVVEVPELESDAELLADRYGKAIMALLAQQGALGTYAEPDTGTTIPFAQKTVLDSAPRTELVENAPRRFARSVVIARSMIEHFVDESQGPRVPPADPYAQPGNWPTITQIVELLQAETSTGAFNTASGVNVVTPDGVVTVEE